MTRAFTPADTLHRLVKEALDSGSAASLAEAESMYRNFDLSFDIGKTEARDPFHRPLCSRALRWRGECSWAAYGYRDRWRLRWRFRCPSVRPSPRL